MRGAQGYHWPAGAIVPVRSHEKLLAIAVIGQALTDATRYANSPADPYSPELRQKVRRWLLYPNPTREYWLDMAGIPRGWLRPALRQHHLAELGQLNGHSGVGRWGCCRWM